MNIISKIDTSIVDVNPMFERMPSSTDVHFKFLATNQIESFQTPDSPR